MTFSIPFLVVAVAFAICLLILLCYYVYFFTRLKQKPISNSADNEPVSVLIAARNELPNLEKNLTAILNQNYPKFEVIVINDGSFDGTKDFLKVLNETYSHLKIVTLELDERFHRGKKFALTMGIKAASYERLLFTDADCKPASEFWIQKMVNAAQGNDVVLGFSPLNVPSSILGSIISYETFHTALQYATYSLRKRTYMGVGRNLSYTKTLFFKHKGFAKHQHILSGDDDLFVQEVATKDNVSLCLDYQAFTYSDSEKTLVKWIRQKRRHLSAGKLYKSSIKRLLSVYTLAQVFFYLLFPVLIILNPSLWFIPIGGIVLKWMIQWMVMYKSTIILKAPKIGKALPFYDVLYTMYLVLFGVLKPFSRKAKWN